MKLEDNDNTKQYIDKALKVWVNADANYLPYQNALITLSKGI
jgi:hypothetical protein